MQIEIESMVTRTRAQATKRMVKKSLTESAHKKSYHVCTRLSNKDVKYVCIVKDILPEKPGSQDGLDVMLIQASVDNYNHNNHCICIFGNY